MACTGGPGHITDSFHLGRVCTATSPLPLARHWLAVPHLRYRLVSHAARCDARLPAATPVSSIILLLHSHALPVAQAHQQQCLAILNCCFCMIVDGQKQTVMCQLCCCSCSCFCRRALLALSSCIAYAWWVQLQHHCPNTESQACVVCKARPKLMWVQARSRSGLPWRMAPCNM